jgi:hypothetical protein
LTGEKGNLLRHNIEGKENRIIDQTSQMYLI